jgi:hypothetical protein
MPTPELRVVESDPDKAAAQSHEAWVESLQQPYKWTQQQIDKTQRMVLRAITDVLKDERARVDDAVAQLRAELAEAEARRVEAEQQRIEAEQKLADSLRIAMTLEFEQLRKETQAQVDAAVKELRQEVSRETERRQHAMQRMGDELSARLERGADAITSLREELAPQRVDSARLRQQALVDLSRSFSG